MLNWFKRNRAAASGPDYTQIDTREKAQELYKRGELTTLLLLPGAFGGEAVPQNVVYVPAAAAAMKMQIDENTVRPLAQSGRITRYTATPEYVGRSVVPSLVRISAWDPGNFEAVVHVWGQSLKKGSEHVSNGGNPEQAGYVPASAVLNALSPDAFVRAYIADYETWNRWAYETTAKAMTKESMAAAELAYVALLGKYCPPGRKHQPISFGSDSLHDHGRETVLEVHGDADSRVVKTRHTKVVGKTTINDEFEYHLKKIGGRWFLTSNLYVSAEGKLECL